MRETVWPAVPITKPIIKTDSRSMKLLVKSLKINVLQILFIIIINIFVDQIVKVKT